ncbi:MAG: CvpA family protein [Deltaproteobacteria bacterium]|nr:CvpA family protein [Deltaproteobacteria bacterium]
MNWIDLTVYIIIIFFVLIGTTRGLVRQVFSISALVGGIIIGLIFYDVFAAMFIKDSLVKNESIANVSAFLIVSFLSYLLIQILGWLTIKLMGTLHLSWINRLGGAILGIIIGSIAALLFTSSLTLFISEKDPAITNSVTIPYINETYETIKRQLPEDLRESLIRSRELIREEGLKAAMRIKDSEKIKEILNNK